MKWIIAVIGSAFVITVGVLVGTKVSADALTLIIGVVIGIVASVPTTLLFAYVVSRRSEPRLGTPLGFAPGTYPPVVVVNPGAGMGLPWGQATAAPAALPAPVGPRQYQVVGDLSEAEEGMYEAR